MLRPSRIGAIHLSLVAAAGALVVRTGYVQLWEGRQWAAIAAQEHAARTPVLALRGPFLDAAGNPLVITRGLDQLGIAPREVRDRVALARALARSGVSPQWIRRAVDARQNWVTLPTHVLPGAAAAAAAVRGVYAAPVADRVSLGSEGAAALIGHVGTDGRGKDGLEAALDSVLRGDPARALVQRDALGRALESPGAPPVSAQAGDVVVLTLNRGLEDICERALDDAVARQGATGGDIVVLDPHDGAVLAMASRRPGAGGAAVTALTEPFEPGSTIKPFIAAALLTRGRVAPSDVVDIHGGRIVIAGRTITDSHVAMSKALTLRDVIRWSSNVGIAQFAQRLSPREEYEALRDAGFGSATGLPFQAEAGGTLRDPLHWSRQSPASLAIGYEIAVTPLQLAVAYAAIANGGELLEPALVREIRTSDGTVVYQRDRRVVRRLMSPQVAEQLRDMLIETVAKGTASEADIPSYIVAGKTGTARRTQYGAGYGSNQYTASFVGLFPGHDPQYVILVKLDNPSLGSYFGGRTAAPLSREILEAAIAARDAALDRRVLAASRRVAFADTVPVARIDTTVSDSVAEIDTTTDTPVTVPVGTPPGAVRLPRAQPTAAAASAVVPDVRGMPLRAAARALHRSGLHVALVPGPLGETEPGAGSTVRAGSVVRLGQGS